MELLEIRLVTQLPITTLDAAQFFMNASSFDDNGTLPNGLVINNTTGAITGTATATGTFNVVITGSDATGNSDTIAFDWVIS